ncbi:g002 [Yersinia phage phiR1-37]|uniref:hypothetical protein n=1 Tax=Yersinia phage phiR1-37 TaxID=331278 RepID=UPI00022DBCAE|nr:hypothetical protein phiR1-37_gp002 [Yersinia phage phiR1-37]CCE26026.1 g002 [Yersinia phage phiR1-37]
MKILKATNPRWFAQSNSTFSKFAIRGATEVLSDWMDNAFSAFCQLYEIHYDAGSSQVPKRKLLVKIHLRTVWNSSKMVDNVHN